MSTIIDFSASLPSAASIKAAGHDGVMLYCSPGREDWMKAKQPPRFYLDDLDAHGIKFGFVWQYGGADNPDAMRGYQGGRLDAQMAQDYLDSVNCSGHPVIFAVDFNITLAQWNTTAVEYFKGAMSVLGRRRVGIYGHSRVVHWAMEDNVVAEVAPGRVLGWVTRSWSNGATGSTYATMYQHTHNVPGPSGVQVDINSTYHPEWGWRAIPHRPDMRETSAVDVSELPRFDTRKLMAKHFSTGRVYNGIRYQIEYITRHHVAGLAGLAKSVDGRDGCWDIWQTRQASAHAVAYQRVPGQGPGIVGQLVRPEDTSWSNANSISNRKSYSIEHQNSAGSTQDWPITDEVLRAGAEHAAEVLFMDELGPPVFGKNIRDHREFAGTSCPHHIAFGGKYHEKWMRYCADHYRRLRVTGGLFMSLPVARQEDLAAKIDRIAEKMDRVHFEVTHEYETRFPGSNFRETLIGYMLEGDRKVEDVHANMLPTMYALLTEMAEEMNRKGIAK